MPHSYRIRFHPRARRLKLKVHRDASVEVVAPPGVDQRLIREFVGAHSDWVDANRNRMLAHRSPGPEAGPFPAALALRALGEETEVRYLDARRPQVRWASGQLTIDLVERDVAIVRELLVRALKMRADQRIGSRLTELAVAHRKRFGKLSWRNQKTRWGSCSSNGNISLNVRLLFLPPDLVDYVLVHELAHLDHPDHSRRFWNAVEAMMPGALQRRREIRQADRFLPDWIISEAV